MGVESGLQRFLLLLLVWSLSNPVQACPGFLFIDNFGPNVKTGKRKELNAFVIRKRDGKDQWVKIPLQIDPFSLDGKLKFFEAKDQWLEETLQGFDRLSMEPAEFGDRYYKKLGFPCDATHVFEITTRRKQYAYLAFCRDAKSWNHQIPFHTIRHDPKNFEVKTPNFLYRYARDNHLLFNRVALSYDNPTTYPLIIAEKSDQIIRGDVKNFFTLNFDRDDIEVQIAKERRGPLGLVGSVNFWLKIMFFSIDLRLSPEVSFFHDAVFMPMVMHLPVDARKYLNPGSGLFYTWGTGRDVLVDYQRSRIPVLDPAKVKAGPKALSELGLPFCEKKQCAFKIVGEIAHRLFALDFNIGRPLVELGFFPLLMSDVQSTARDFGWSVTSYDEPGRMGMYFETSGMPQGNHDWEFLIRFADDYSALNKQCPAELQTVAGYRRPQEQPTGRTP